MLVMFDCDGVLIDSEAIFCSVDAEALTGLGFPTAPAVISERFAGIPHYIAWRTLAEELNLSLPDDWVETILRECDRRFKSELKTVVGASEAITAIRDRGHQACVASSTDLSALRANLERVGLLGQLTPNIYSVSQVRRPKPAPDVFLFAASQMGFDPNETVVVEDSVAGVTAAKRAGMQVVGFSGGGHTYELLGARLLNAGADRVCSSMVDVVEFLAPAKA